MRDPIWGASENLATGPGHRPRPGPVVYWSPCPKTPLDQFPDATFFAFSFLFVAGVCGLWGRQKPKWSSGSEVSNIWRLGVLLGEI